MKIIVSSHDSVAPLRGGGAIRTLKVAKEFKKRGHNVVLIAPSDAVSEVEGVKVEWLHPPRKERSQILSSIKFNIRLLRKFLWFIEDADMLFIHNAISAAFVPLLKLFFSFKFILDITDIHSEYILIQNNNIFKQFFKYYLLKYEYWIINHADILIVATYAMKRLLIKNKIPKNKIKVVYDGADIINFNQSKELDSENTIIHLGAIDSQHGVELLVQAIPRVIKKNKDAKFLFIGGGPKLSSIKSLSKKLNIYDRCIFSGSVEHSNAVAYLKKSTLGVITRNDILPNRVITTLKIYEYWASATAVVAASLDGLREVAENGRDVLFFNPGDVDDLAKKISNILTDKELRENLTQRGLKKVKNFNWDNLISRIVDISFIPFD